jgi:hypothetical protein
VSYIHSDADRHDLLLKVGSDDQVKVYLNGEPVLTHSVERVLKIDDDAVPGISLRKGTNVLVLKVVNERLDWSACARFTSKDGKRLSNLKATGVAP